MAITNGYCSLADVKAALRIQDSVDDSLIEQSVEAASREIDGFCNRYFYSTTATRVFIPQDDFVTNIDDVVSITSLKTSSNGETYDTTWAVTDYQLEPLNALSGGLATSYTRVRAVGDYTFPTWNASGTFSILAPVQIVGVFGWSAVPSAIKQAAIILAMRQFKRFDSPLGIAGYGDLGAIRIGRVDPDIEALIQPFRRVVVS